MLVKTFAGIKTGVSKPGARIVKYSYRPITYSSSYYSCCGELQQSDMYVFVYWSVLRSYRRYQYMIRLYSELLSGWRISRPYCYATERVLSLR